MMVKLQFRLGLQNGLDLHVNKCQKIQCYCARSSKEKKRIRKKNAKSKFFYLTWCVSKLCDYSNVIHSFYWKSAVEHDGGV